MSNGLNKIERSLELARKTAVRSPDYLATRVLAELDAQASGKQVRIWQWLSAALLASLVAVVSIVSFQDKGFEAIVLQPHVVKVELEKFVAGEQFEVEVILPENVEFYSTSFPEIREQRTMRFAVKGPSAKDRHLIAPFVIRGSNLGKRKVKVNFYNEQQELVMQKDVHIEFRGEGT